MAVNGVNLQRSRVTLRGPTPRDVCPHIAGADLAWLEPDGQDRWPIAQGLCTGHRGTGGWRRPHSMIGAPTTRFGALETPRPSGKEDTLPSAGEIGGRGGGKT